MSSATVEEEPLSARRITSVTPERSGEPDPSQSECQPLERSPTAAGPPAEAADKVKAPCPSTSSAHETRHLELQEILKSLNELLQNMMVQNKETRKQLKRDYIEHRAYRKTLEKERHNMECDQEDRRLERQFREEQERKHLREVSEGWRRRLALMNNDLLT